ncbi:MAG: tyrosine-type recombinase/integrase, partial [Polyangiaceae bacterium]|nr:tyrosine-type recombinase/integrase [Polyangiaceae bacterium]
MLKSLDRFVARHTPDASTLSEDVVRGFVVARPMPSRSNAVTLLRQLGRFLAAEDCSAFVAPPKYLGARRRPLPARVLTLAEVRLFLDSTELLKATAGSPYRDLSHATALRTLLMTGLRRDELRMLRDADVDLHANVIAVRHGKFGKSRHVPLSTEFAKRLRRFRLMLHERVEHRLVSDAFFPGPDGHKPMSAPSLYDAFRKTIAMAGIKHGGRGAGPRLHDLRHTFAVLRLLTWYRQGEDLHAKLPLLATYMGHVGVGST